MTVVRVCHQLARGDKWMQHAGELQLTSIGRRDFSTMFHQQFHGFYIITRGSLVECCALAWTDSAKCVSDAGDKRSCRKAAEVLV